MAETANLLMKIEKPEITAAARASFRPWFFTLFIEEDYSGQTCLPVSVSMMTMAFVGQD